MRRDTGLASSRPTIRRTVPGAPYPTFLNSKPGRSPVSDAPSQAAPADARRIRMAARAMARAGLVHAYGHCSLRLRPDRFIVSPPKPLGLIGTGDSPVTVPAVGELPSEALGEVVIHQHIYRRRGDVG